MLYLDLIKLNIIGLRENIVSIGENKNGGAIKW
jgi:hypothetical protein